MLLLYLIIHAGGNALYLAGPEAMNAYSALLRGPFGVAVRCIEVYLLLAFVAHACAAAFLTNKYGNLSPSGSVSDWWRRARLMLSGSCVTAFLYFHLQHFRLGQGFKDIIAAPPVAHNLYAQVTDVLRDPRVAALYVAAVVVIGSHSYWGVEKAVLKFGAADASAKPHASRARAIFQALVVAATAVFVAVTAAAHLGGQAGGRKQGS
jgi:succinate dehydrogenase/fumarate reductase cytochrome b subunit (b558 family)